MRDKHIALYLLVMVCLLLLIISISSLVFASPIINSIIFSPSTDLWLGENLTITINCTDNENYTIENVSTQIIGNNGYIIPNKTFQHKGNNIYETIIEALYMNKANSFSINIVCINNESIYTTQYSSFIVYNFSAMITSGDPIFIYKGDQIEIDINVRKNNTPISSDVSFNIKINNETVKPKIDPPYDPLKGWILYFDSPNKSKTYDIEIAASHGRANATIRTNLTVEDPIRFSIRSLSKILVKSGEEINLDVDAYDRGSIIPLNKDNLEITIGSGIATIKTITPVSDYFKVKIEVPDLSAGQYTLTAALKYENYTYPDNEAINYAVPISGKFVDENGRSTSTEIRFLSDGAEKLRLNTKTDGSYESSIQVGTYDIIFIFPESKLELKDVYVSNFEDPLNYYFSTSDDLTPGLKSAGFFVYETTLLYSKAIIEMKYNERDVYDESAIELYKCSDWNQGKKICYSGWKESGAIIDDVRNIVTFEGSGLSAYAIGTIKELSVEFGVNKEKYYIRDLIELKGATFDTYRNIVDNVTVRMNIKNTDISKTAVSDSNGIFSIEFLSPEKEGSYTLYLSAEKYPYIEFNSSLKIEVVKSREISINFPDTIKLKQGQDLDQELILKNTGQADLYDLNISLTGISKEYYNLTNFIGKIKSGEEKKIWMYFFIPANASLGTSSATIKVFNDVISKEKIFGFTILEINQTITSKPSPTGFFTLPKIVLPKISTIYMYILILLFAIGSFTSAILLKRKKKKGVKRNDSKKGIPADLLELKNQITRQHSAEYPQNTTEYSMQSSTQNQSHPDMQLTWDQLKEKWLNGKSVGDWS